MTGSGRWRYHAQLDDCKWMLEIPSAKVRGYDGYLYEVVWINTNDAADRGIKDGDICKVYNDRGTILCGARVNERIMSGATMVKHGSRPDWIVPGMIDRGGSASGLTTKKWLSKNTPGQHLTGFLVEVEKLSASEMDEWRRDYPEAFSRPYDPASGLRFDAWVEGGE
jgi:trimethylamine-N-oxide reductase (cytochrome c)